MAPTSSRASARTFLMAVLGLLGLVAGALSLSAPAGAAIAAPTFERQIGFSGHAGVYAWGMATARDGSILVGDYWNYNIRRYSTDGRLLDTISSRGTGPGQNMAPHGLATDPNDGSIYMADMNWPWKIHKYAADGTWIRSIGTYQFGVTVPYPYVTRVAVLSDGTLLSLSSHNVASATTPFQHRVLKYSADGTYLGSWGVNGSQAGQLGLQRGFAVGPNDEVYLGDATKGLIQVFDKDGNYLRSIGAGRFPGDMRGLAVDFDNKWLYAVDAYSSQVEKFELDGTWLGAFGSEGEEDGQFRDGGREITVGQDHRVYVADFGNNRVNVFEPDGTYVDFMPNPAPAAPAGGFNQPQDVTVSPDGKQVFVVDTYNHRVQKFNPAGDPVKVWGFRGSDVAGGNAMNYPRGITFSKGEVFVMNSREGDVKVYSNNGVYKRSLLEWGREEGQTNLARGVHVDGTGRIYVADSNNRRIQVFNAAGSLLWTAPCGGPPPPPPSMSLFAGCTGVDTDGQGNVYAAAPTEHTVYKYSPTGALLQKIGSLGSGNGQLRAPYDVAIWKGKLYVTESNNRRVSVFNFRGGYQGRFGSRGEGDGQFEQPRGIDIDNNGKAYVVDGLLERVSVFQLR
jgi:tripartite motif-containing protein 71